MNFVTNFCTQTVPLGNNQRSPIWAKHIFCTAKYIGQQNGCLCHGIVVSNVTMGGKEINFLHFS